MGRRFRIKCRFDGLGSNADADICQKLPLEGRAKSFVRSERGLNTWLKLRRGLIAEFKRKVNSAKIHTMLSERKMKKDEELHDYFYSMKELAAQGNFEEAALIQYVIDGIKDLHINKAMLYGADTIKKFKEKLDEYESFTTAKPKNYNEVRTAEKKTMYVPNKEDNKLAVKCYNCGAKGHISLNCPNKSKGVKCFGCNKFGHTAKDCKNKTAEDKQSNVRCVTAVEVDRQVKKNPMHKKIRLGTQEHIALFDTGCKVNIMKLKVYEQLGTLTLVNSTLLLRGFGNKENTIRPIGKCSVDIEIDGDVFDLEFNVVSNECMDVEVVIGCPICEKAQVVINSEGIYLKKL